jgi:hypothetical protein
VTPEESVRRNKIWKALSARMRHMALMYIYRLHTDLENITSYVETYHFINSGLTLDDLPEFVTRSRPHQLREEAYEVIGQSHKLKELR